jgi:hypothetical protein
MQQSNISRVLRSGPERREGVARKMRQRIAALTALEANPNMFE